MMSEIYYGPIIWTGHVYYAVIIIYRAPPHTLHVLELSYTDPHSECGVTALFVYFVQLSPSKKLVDLKFELVR